MSNPAPRCSCVVCHKDQSVKGIYSHYIIAHTINGNIRHKAISKIGYQKSAESSSKKFAKERANLKLLYDLNPSYCEMCDAILPFSKKSNRFCNSSCSAKFSNIRRRESGWKHSAETKHKISTSIKNNLKLSEYTKIKFHICEICGNNFIWSSITKGSHRVCSSNCLHELRSFNARKNPGLCIKRSKDEIALFNLCASYYTNVSPNLSIIHGWDADIVIHDIKTAILWNGPWHYKEMNIGNHSLLQVQNRDKIKTQLFKDAGWNVLIFEDRYYTPQTAFNAIIGGPSGIRTHSENFSDEL